MNQAFVQLLKRVVLNITQFVGYRQSEGKIVAQSDRFWKESNAAHFPAYSHWRGNEGIADNAWLELGQQHLDLFNKFKNLVDFENPLERVVEWGCGGGSNAIHFAKEAQEFIGVDVSGATLEECRKTLHLSGITNFTSVLIDVAAPELACNMIKEPCDLFLCTYVMELVPTPEYGKRIVDIAIRLLRPGGLAIIQTKYSTAEARTRPRRWGYRHNAANMTTYPIDKFWKLAETSGFNPLALTLRPRQELIGDERYAYYILQRPAF